jgi:hypothetical protein
MIKQRGVWYWGQGIIWLKDQHKNAGAVWPEIGGLTNIAVEVAMFDHRLGSLDNEFGRPNNRKP